jgi:drug/metabolite transporter (DMT)-like permease
MNPYLLTAAGLTAVIALVHSVLGEREIFQGLRQGKLVPTHGGSALRERHVRILWAVWHIVSVFGGCLAYVLYHLAQPATAPTLRAAFVPLLAATMALSALLVLYGTKGRHPAWVGLFVVAGLAWAGLP